MSNTGSAQPTSSTGVAGEHSSRPGLSTDVFLLTGFLGVLWAFLIAQLSHFWGTEGYYFYGWFVPLLALYLFYRRWRNQPPAEASARRPGWLGIILLLLPAYIFLRLVGSSMPDWRLVIWGQAFVVWGITLSTLAYLGGPRWALHFWFPVLFIVSAAAWPGMIETNLVQSLTHGVTSVTLETLLLLGLPATIEGNRLIIGEHTVTVGDVCSGIRSLQALMMVALFFGENAEQTWPKRIVLMLSAFFFAFIFNCARALTLTFIEIRGGAELFEKWHDNVGMIAFGLGALSLFLVSEFMKKPAEQPVSTHARPRLAFRRGFILPIFLILVLFEGSLEGWYRFKEAHREIGRGWTLDLEGEINGATIREGKLGPDVERILAQDQGSMVRLRTESGRLAELYFLEWFGGTRGLIAAYHGPEVCMVQYGGAEMARYEENMAFSAAGFNFNVRGYDIVYRDRGYTMPTFQMIWFAGKDRASLDNLQGQIRMGSPSQNIATAFQRLRDGNRDFPMKLVLIGIENERDFDKAWQTAQNLVTQLIEVEEPDGGGPDAAPERTDKAPTAAISHP